MLISSRNSACAYVALIASGRLRDTTTEINRTAVGNLFVDLQSRFAFYFRGFVFYLAYQVQDVKNVYKYYNCYVNINYKYN